MADTIEHIEALLSGHISLEAAEWLRAGFAKHIEGQSLATALGLGSGHNLRTALLRRKWRAEIAKAVLILDAPGVSSRSIATIISREFSRQARSRRPPETPLERAVAAARKVYSAPATNANALWHVVHSMRQNTIRKAHVV